VLWRFLRRKIVDIIAPARDAGSAGVVWKGATKFCGGSEIARVPCFKLQVVSIGSSGAFPFAGGGGGGVGGGGGGWGVGGGGGGGGGVWGGPTPPPPTPPPPTMFQGGHAACRGPHGVPTAWTVRILAHPGRDKGKGI